jgi:iron complex outermembrane receptor protein
MSSLSRSRRHQPPRARGGRRWALAVGLAASPAAFAQAPAAAAPPADAASAPVQRVEITGSSIRRVDAETALPVQIIGHEEIQNSGAANVGELLNHVSAIASNGIITPSMAAGATTGGISSASLRGLGATRTLVLVNGRRVSPFGAIGDSVSVDVNSLPLSAIDRVEVLKDGASAVYGSDAIAGVVNFILRRNVRGGEVDAEYGTTFHDDAQVTRLSMVVGHGDTATDGFNVTLIGTYSKEGGLFGGDRSFSRSSINVAQQNDTTSGNAFPANIVINGKTYNPEAPDNCAPSVSSPIYGPRTCRYDPASQVQLIPPTERLGVMANATAQINPDLEAFIELSTGQNTVYTTIQPVPISDQFALPPTNPLFNVSPYNGFATIVLQPGTPYYPSDFVQNVVGAGQPLPDVLVRYRAVDNGPREMKDVITPTRAVLGLRGTLGSWDLDGNLLYSSSTVREHVFSGYPEYSQILPLLNSGQVNFFGPNTPDIDAAIKATEFHGDAYVNKSSLSSIAAKGSRDLWQLAGGPVAFALGGEGRQETYASTPNATIEEGDVSGYGGNFLPVDRKRNVGAVFSEIDLPFAKGAEVDLAVRYDHYQGSGSATTPKASVRWQPMRELVLRGSVGRGFRAPSLTDLYGPQVTGSSANGQSDPLRCNVDGNTSSNDCGTQFPILAGGNPDLKPERSTNFTLGMVAELPYGFSLSLDGFDIKLTNTIIPGVPVTSILADLGRFGYLVQRGPVDPNTPTLPGPIVQINQLQVNLGETRITGVDIDANWKFPRTSVGAFVLGLQGTWYGRYDVQAPDGTWSHGIADANSLASANAAGIVPRWKHYLSLNWKEGAWSGTFAQNYQTGYKDVPNVPFGDPTDPTFQYHHVGSYQTFDLIGNYEVNKQWLVSLGLKNVFDSNPPYTNNGGQAFFQAGYDPSYADPRGRFIYGRASYRF